MGKFTLTHEINCNVETFWKIFFDKTFNDVLYKQQLGFPQWEELSRTENDKEIRRKASGTPKMDMPGPVAKLMGSSFSYVEDGVFDKTAKTWKWKLTTSAMPDKIRNEGSMRLEAVGDNKVRRISELVVEAKIFGVGGMIESSAEKSLREGWERSAKFMNQWIADGKGA